MIHLFCGPETGEKQEAIDLLRTQAQKKFGTLDMHSFYAVDANMQELIALLQNESLFADARFIVLNDVHLVKKTTGGTQLAGWIAADAKNKDSRSVLILTTSETACEKIISDAVPKQNTKIFWELFENQKETWLKNFFRKNSYTITDDAVHAILDLIDNDTAALRHECSRFFLCMAPNATVTEDDVEKILSHDREESAFTLFDSLSLADLSAALEKLQIIGSAKSSSPQALIAGLTYCFRRLADFHELLSENSRPDDFELKRAGFASKKAQNQYKTAARTWNRAETQVCLKTLGETDLSLRKNGTRLADTAMQIMLYSLVHKKEIARFL